jgi:hypothetical protein
MNYEVAESDFRETGECVVTNYNDEIKKGYAGLAWATGGYQPESKPETYTLPKVEHGLTNEELLDLYEKVLDSMFQEIVKEI